MTTQANPMIFVFRVPIKLESVLCRKRGADKNLDWFYAADPSCCGAALGCSWVDLDVCITDDLR